MKNQISEQSGKKKKSENYCNSSGTGFSAGSALLNTHTGLQIQLYSMQWLLFRGPDKKIHKHTAS